MYNAKLRSFLAVPPKNIEELRPRKQDARKLVLFCVSAQCTACHAFKTGPDRKAFEKTLGDEVHIVTWPCDSEAHRHVALLAGVKRIPAYVIVPCSGDIEIRTP